MCALHLVEVNDCFLSRSLVTFAFTYSRLHDIKSNNLLAVSKAQGRRSFISQHAHKGA